MWKGLVVVKADELLNFYRIKERLLWIYLLNAVKNMLAVTWTSVSTSINSNMIGGFLDFVDLWIIKIKKSLLSFVHVVRWDQVNNPDHAARTCERSVYSIVKIARLYDYRTWQTPYVEKFTRCAKVCGLFLDADWLSSQTPITWITRYVLFVATVSGAAVSFISGT